MTAVTLMSGDRVVSDSAVTVVFPHAGGSPRFFRHWGRVISGSLFGVTYPGRDHRVDDASPSDLVTLAESVAVELATVVVDAGRLTLVGHSMGAWVAFEAAAVLHRMGIESRVVVSGQNPPHLSPGTALHTAGDDELISDIVRQNPAVAEIWQTPELRRMFLPVVREDYRLLETYIPSGAMVGDLVVVAGHDDCEVDHARLDEWRRYSEARTVVVEVDGGHFYLAQPDVQLPRLILGGTS